MSSSASPMPSCSATRSWCSSTSRSVCPATRCNATRAVEQRRHRAVEPLVGRHHGGDLRRARARWRRRDCRPGPSFRSGSSACATSPAARCRSCTIASSAGSRFLARSRHSLAMRSTSLSPIAASPAIDARVEQTERGLQVVVGDRARLVGRADAVVELEARVPDRVPEPVGERADVATSPPVVDQDEVEIARRAQLAPAVAHRPRAARRPARRRGGRRAIRRPRPTPPRRRRGRPARGRRRARARRA